MSSSAAAEPQLVERTLLAGRYRLERLLSDLGAAHCWRAQDEVLARPVAVRVLESPTQAEAQAFLDAAGRAGQVAHPGLVGTFDAAHEDVDGVGRVCYDVVEWIDGPTLAQQVLADGPMPAQRATTMARQVAEALAALHRAGLRHGAVHPGTVVLTATGPIKLTGAAVAAVLGGPGPDDTVALAATLYAALTARWPFGAAHGLPAAPRTDRGAPCAPRQVRAGVPRELDAVVIRALDPRRRPTLSPITDPQAFADALALLPAEPLNPEPGPAPGPRPRRRLPRWARRLIAVSVVALIAVVGYALGLAIGHVPGTRGG
ncbi:MAG: protein kinase family protein [Mycobacteriales bacterium]